MKAHINFKQRDRSVFILLSGTARERIFHESTTCCCLHQTVNHFTTKLKIISLTLDSGGKIYPIETIRVFLSGIHKQKALLLLAECRLVCSLRFIRLPVKSVSHAAGKLIVSQNTYQLFSDRVLTA